MKKKAPARGISDLALKSSNTSPQATTSTGSIFQATIHSSSLFGAQAPGASQTTGVSGLSDSSFAPTPQASTGSISEATITSGLCSPTPQDTSTSRAPSTRKAPVASLKISEMAPKQSPPIPFDKFASSEIFTIRVGTNLQTFHVHKDLLAGLSDEMRNYVYSDTKEDQEISMEMEHVSPDIMHRFMEFCYSGDYLYASGSESNSDDPLKDKDATDALPLLLTHAKLYVFANMFNIVSLKKLSRSKIIALTSFFGQLEDRAHALAMISLIDFVLQNIPAATETPDKLVKFLARYAGYLIEKLGGYPEFHAVLAGSAREDFFKVFCGCVKAGEGKAPWTDAE
ncbi:hypothetical protein B9Z19DRAFT_979589 [Tuber borchii]|uniref:BTB domain-containing protein n=1 Tax=Tuber borchii TaxID=42251 RepID=A0A2T6ZVF3_TUBBO|nr:hypothetical protein B9Z19DRAFT_979589 [Tuber borchii]